MSLKGFHLVFVSVSLLLFAFLTLWGFFLTEERSTTATALGVTGVIGLLLTPVYGVYFLRKARNLES